ncbi:T9SS type A sorting domain-containing protein [Bizionia arctica]|nr:T9SS type A sorting domain-containing protein [Bizionia arctica]
MKTQYSIILTSIIIGIALLFTVKTYAQPDIHFTFANAEITNDGVNDFYEVDVLIQTINNTGTFKLSSGQLYFTYNTLAFGENVRANDNIEFLYPENQGYILAQGVDATAAAKIYGVFTVNDNTDSRVSWACSQVFAAATFADDNITETPQRLLRIKIEFTDNSQLPMVMFEDGEAYIHQFYTVCGPFAAGPFESADCGAFPGTQIVVDTYDSSAATLSIPQEEQINQISIYPNPASDYIHISTSYIIQQVEIFDILGKKVKVVLNSNQIAVSNLQAGIYIVKVFTDKGEITKKIVIE